jgi:hypothetical protein
MEKLELVSMALGTPGRLGVNRKSELNQTLGFRETGNILSYELRGDSHDINREVLEMMATAAQDILDISTPLYSGDYTAKELAGRVCGCIDMVMLFTNEQYVSYERIRITAGSFKCQFNAKDIFRTMAEWESMMGVTQKQAHRFPCEAQKAMDKNVQVKAYKCSRTFRFPSGKVVDPDEEVIKKKYGDLGRLWRTLTDEGMRKALSVAVALKRIEAAYDTELAEIAERLLCKKLHEAYGIKDTAAVAFNEDYFKYAPDCYKQVDEAYARSQYMLWEEFFDENAAPTWIEKDMEVQFKNQENVTKKWQGRLKVLNVFPEMDFYAHRIVWKASVCTTKGKWSNVCHPVDRFEAFAEPMPKRKASQVKSEKRRVKNESNPEPFASRRSEANATVNHEPSISDRLRAALRARLVAA